MANIRDWSITASANTGNAVDGYFKEGMAYSDVNDAAREMQAILARDLGDRNGTLISTGSTSSYIVQINADLAAYQDGDLVAFQAHAKNDGATTLRLRMLDGDSLSDRPMVSTNISALSGGEIQAGGTYLAYYKSASANFQLINPSIEVGTFTPVFTFATPGDLSVAYGAARTGNFWKIGPLVYYAVTVQCTPTFSTASSFLNITGLPYTAAASPTANVGSIQLGGTGVTYSTGYDFVVSYVEGSSAIIQLLQQGSTKTVTRVTSAEITSAVELFIRAQGFFAVA